RRELEHQSAGHVGIELRREGARMVFVPGTATVTKQMRELFAGADVVLFDGTLFADDEMIRTGTGQKPGRRMGHMQIDGDDGSLRALTGLSARRIFIHINNTNPILVDGSAERRKVENAGWQVAEDGMEIVLWSF